MTMTTETREGMNRHRSVALLALMLLAFATPSWAQGELDAAGTAAAFSAAIVAGDEATAKSLLDPDVLIYESGRQENSRDEYAAHHLKGDMAFLAKARVQVLDRKHGTNGDLAWVATRSRISGTHKEKPVDVFSTETMVLKRVTESWRIVHIQWSSRPVEPKVKPHEPASRPSR